MFHPHTAGAHHAERDGYTNASVVGWAFFGGVAGGVGKVVDGGFDFVEEAAEFVDLGLLLDEGVVELVDVVLQMRQQGLHLGDAFAVGGSW